jgi:hypothetical protein
MLHGTFAIGILIDVNVILCNIKLIGLAFMVILQVYTGMSRVLGKYPLK